MSQAKLFWRLTLFFSIIALFTALSLWNGSFSSENILTAAVIDNSMLNDNLVQESVTVDGVESLVVSQKAFFVNEVGFVEDVGIVFADGSIQR